MDPLVIHIVNQVCHLRRFSNMILAKMFISLNRFKKNGIGTLRAPTTLLQIWFLSYLKESGSNMKIIKISKESHPIQEFQRIIKFIPQRSFSGWIGFLEDITRKQILWQLLWAQFPKTCLAHESSYPILLLEFTRFLSYYPVRMTRQYRVL